MVEDEHERSVHDADAWQCVAFTYKLITYYFVIIIIIVTISITV